MKKIIIALLISSALLSCKKESAQSCYVCTFGTINGYTRPDEVYCGPMPHTWKDGSGNDIQSFCIPK